MAKNKYYARNTATKPKKSWRSKALLWTVVALVMFGGSAGAWVWHKHRQHTAAVTANTSHINATQKNGKSTSSSTQQSSQPSATQTNKNPTPSDTDNQSLESPGTYSSFASSHSVTSGTLENTVCITTPGASCTVEFKQGDVVKSLPAQSTDSTGSAYFYWTPGKVKLSPGNWSIILKVTLNGASKTAQDNITLQVAP